MLFKRTITLLLFVFVFFGLLAAAHATTISSESYRLTANALSTGSIHTTEVGGVYLHIYSSIKDKVSANITTTSFSASWGFAKAAYGISPNVSLLTLRDRTSGSTVWTKERIISVEATANKDFSSPQSMAISESPVFSAWIAYQNPTTFEVSTGDGTKKVYYAIRDAALFQSKTLSSEVILDTVPPILTSTVPRSGALDIETSPEGAVIYALFSEPLNSATVNKDSFLLNKFIDKTSVEGSVTSESSPLPRARFILVGSLEASTTYEATIKGSITDLAGNPVSAESWSFTTKKETPLAPLATAITYSIGGTTIEKGKDNFVSPQPTICLVFPESMNTPSVNRAIEFKAIGPNEPRLTGRMMWSDDKRTLYFIPDKALLPDKTYSLYIGSEAQDQYDQCLSVKDASGKYVCSGLTVPSFKIYSGAITDEVKPYIVTFSPPANEGAVSPSPTVSVLFSEAMSTRETENAFVLPGVKANWGFGWRGKNLIQWAYHGKLPSGSNSITIETTAQDTSGNTLEATKSWSFSVEEDHTPPEVLALLIGETGDKKVKIEITFSEALSPETVTTTNFKVKGSTGEVAATVTWDSNTNSVVITLEQALAASSSYQLIVTSDVMDESGNRLKTGVTEGYVTTFSTEDTIPPVIKNVSFDGRRFRAGDIISSSSIISAEVSDETAMDYDNINIRLGSTTIHKNAFLPGDNYADGMLKYQISTPLPEGPYKIAIEIFDKAGNRASWEGSCQINAGEVRIEGSPLATPQPFSAKASAAAGNEGKITIFYTLNVAAEIDMHIYNPEGKAVLIKKFPMRTMGGMAGYNAVAWDAKDEGGNLAGNGIYVFRIINKGKAIGKGYVVVYD